MNGKKYFLAGIGGARMQALVKYLLDTGNEVVGSDMRDFPHRPKLERWGAKVLIGHSADNLPADTDILLYSPAVKEAAPEREKARELGVLERKNSAEIGEIASGKDTIGVAGTHGKTTTTALLYKILKNAGVQPGLLIGTDLPELDASAAVGKGDVLVVEADEFDRSFHDMNCDSAILTNIDPDHLDYYTGGLPEIKDSFRQFLEGLSPQGFLVAYGDDSDVREVVSSAPGKVITYGVSESMDWQLKGGMRQGEFTHWQFAGKNDSQDILLGLPGKDLALDALAAAVAARQYGVEWEIITETLRTHRNAARRMEKIYESDEVIIIDDYGHHPEEIRSVVQAISDFYSDRELYVVFQAHQIARTKNHWEDFVQVLSDIEHLAILPIFVVRDSAGDEYISLAQKLSQATGATFVNDFPEAEKWLGEGGRPAVWLTLGAGETNKLALELKNHLEGEEI